MKEAPAAGDLLSIKVDLTVLAYGERGSVKEQTLALKKKVGLQLLKELDEMTHPVEDRGYIQFSCPRKDIWLKFRKKWGAE